MGPTPARQTIGYFSGHVAIGLMSAVLGPTLPALAARLGEDPEALGILFAVRSLGYLLASFVAGPIYDRRAGHPILVVGLLVIAGGLALVPSMPTRAALIALLGLLGLAQGVVDVGNNILLSRVHGRAVAPYMSALHCFYGVGALLAPLIVDASGSIVWGYGCLALAMLPISGWIAATPGPATVAAPASLPDRPRTPTPRLVWLLVLWFMLCVGAEAGFGGWLFTLATQLEFDDASANHLVSGFWAAFTFGRLLSIVAATRVRPELLLIADIVGAIASLTVLLSSTGEVPLTLATLTLGLSLASLFPATMSLAAVHLELDGAVTSKLFVGASLGSMSLPWVLGYAFALGPRGPLWVILADLLLAAGLLAVIVHGARKRD